MKSLKLQAGPIFLLTVTPVFTSNPLIYLLKKCVFEYEATQTTKLKFSKYREYINMTVAVQTYPSYCSGPHSSRSGLLLRDSRSNHGRVCLQRKLGQKSTLGWNYWEKHTLTKYIVCHCVSQGYSKVIRFKSPVDLYSIPGVINSVIFNLFLKCPIANIVWLGESLRSDF